MSGLLQVYGKICLFCSPIAKDLFQHSKDDLLPDFYVCNPSTLSEYFCNSYTYIYIFFFLDICLDIVISGLTLKC